MAISINLATNRKLLLVKQLFQQAVTISKVRHSEVSRITAIVIFDLSVETMLKTIVPAIAPRKEENLAERFQPLVEQCDAAMTKADLGQLPDKDQIRLTHTIRNDAQHKARYPTEKEVIECENYTKIFLVNACKQVWGEDFEKISMLDVIQHPETKDILSKAEAAIAEKNYSSALMHAQVGLDIAIERVGSVFVRNTSDLARSIDKAELSTETLRFLDEVRKLSILYALGINHIEHLRYEKTCGCVIPSYFGGGVVTGCIVGLIPQPDDVEFAINYAINTVAQIEEYAGNLDKPFSSEQT